MLFSQTFYGFAILPLPGLKVYFWLWEHLCHQVYIFRRTAEILGVQLKILGAKLQILRAPTLKDQKYTPKRVTLKIATRALCSNVGPYFSSI